MPSEIISIDNFSQSNIIERTILTADALSGQAVLSIENADNILMDDFLVVGIPGSETAEKKKIQSVVNLAVTLTSNLSIKHYRNEPIIKLRANQAKIYRAANVDGSVPADASFSSIATVEIQADQLYTEYIDSSGGDGYWYKYTFYNSDTAFESDLAECPAVRGGNYGLYVTVEEVRQEAGLVGNPWIKDQLVYSKLVQAQSEVNGSVILGGYSLPFTTVPELVRNATLLLAAGYILSMEYGPEHTGTNKDGQLKIKMARDILMKIEKKQTELTDPVTSATIGSDNSVRGYPDDSAESATPSEDRMFSVTDRF